MASTQKYIKVNGVLTRNPAFFDGKTLTMTQSTLLPQALVPVTNIQEVTHQNEILDTNQQIVLAPSTEIAIDIMQTDMESKYKTVIKSDGSKGSLLDDLGNVFNKWEISIGLMNKFVELSECNLVFFIDDSGSMDTVDAINMLGHKCSRWEELRDRLIEMGEILSLVPNLGVQLCFINRPDKIKFDYKEHTPDSFKQNFTNSINSIFSKKPSGKTPMLKKLLDIFATANVAIGRTVVYIMTDGLPDEGSETISKLLLTRNAHKIPISLISCSGNDTDVEWLKEVEEKPMLDGSPSYMSECDDFITERNEVLHDQGDVFPYTKGFWLICQILACMNPDDLDALDESVPITKTSLENMMGRMLSPQEYEKYYLGFLRNNRQEHKTLQVLNTYFGNTMSQFASVVDRNTLGCVIAYKRDVLHTPQPQQSSQYYSSSSQLPPQYTPYPNNYN